MNEPQTASMHNSPERPSTAASMHSNLTLSLVIQCYDIAANCVFAWVFEELSKEDALLRELGALGALLKKKTVDLK